MNKLARLESDYQIIIEDFKMRVNAKGRKPILFTKFINEVRDLDDKERCFKFLTDNPTFVDEFKRNIASNVRRQKWVEQKNKNRKDIDETNYKKRRCDMGSEEELIKKKRALESELQAIEIVLHSLSKSKS